LSRKAGHGMKLIVEGTISRCRTLRVLQNRYI
jgi:hypothetical protein